MPCAISPTKRYRGDLEVCRRGMLHIYGGPFRVTSLHLKGQFNILGNMLVGSLYQQLEGKIDTTLTSARRPLALLSIKSGSERKQPLWPGCVLLIGLVYAIPLAIYCRFTCTPHKCTKFMSECLLYEHAGVTTYATRNMTSGCILQLVTCHEITH